MLIIEHLRKNIIFYLLYFVYLLAGMFVLLYFHKGEIVLWLNNHHTLFLDYFFILMTFIAEPYLWIGLAIVLFLYKKKFQLLQLAICMIANAFVVQILKRVIFTDMMRPRGILGDLFFPVNGVEVYSQYAFPSGHSNMAFTIFLLLSTWTKNNLVKLACFFIAFVSTISRMYLFQHFFMDTYAGAFIGMTITTSLIIYLEKYKQSKRFSV